MFHYVWQLVYIARLLQLQERRPMMFLILVCCLLCPKKVILDTIFLDGRNGKIWLDEWLLLKIYCPYTLGRRLDSSHILVLKVSFKASMNVKFCWSWSSWDTLGSKCLFINKSWWPQKWQIYFHPPLQIWKERKGYLDPIIMPTGCMET